jgi:SAM-dependent methyltransferase
MRPDNIDQLKDDLVNFRAELEEPGVREELIATGLPRLLATLEMIPDSLRNADFLELGSSPYFLSLCLHRLCHGTQRRGNYFGTDAKQGCDRLVNSRSGEEIVFDYELFNIETDEFPYPDASFDVVVFSELIEHLGVNPVRTLAEIHRVLRPNGAVIVTTPNALSMERFATFARGGSQMVDRYSPLFGYGARHNREYSPAELRGLLEDTGFDVEDMVLRDLAPHPAKERLQRAVWKRALRLYSDAPREEHIFLRARRRERFRWHFPSGLFDNTQFYVLVRYPWMEMGINDAIQCAAGWYPPERRTADEGWMRWVSGDEGQAFLKTPADVSKFGLEVFAPAASDSPVSVRAIVWDRWLGRVNRENVYVEQAVPLQRGQWQRFELPLQRFPRAGDEVEVKISLISSDAPVDAPGIACERGRGLAVHKVWFG